MEFRPNGGGYRNPRTAGKDDSRASTWNRRNNSHTTLCIDNSWWKPSDRNSCRHNNWGSNSSFNNTRWWPDLFVCGSEPPVDCLAADTQFNRKKLRRRQCV